jgi:hypothetical protein
MPTIVFGFLNAAPSCLKPDFDGDSLYFKMRSKKQQVSGLLEAD